MNMANSANKTVDNSRILDETVGGDEPTQCVFYCAKCHEILGDSTAIVKVNRELKSVSLQFVTDRIDITNECKTSTNGLDKGSSYNTMKCKSCKSVVGRYYKTTPKSLDLIREIYTLDLSTAVHSYHLGRGVINNNNSHLVDPIEKLSEVIFKTQSMLLALNERVEKIEEFLQDIESSDESVQQDQNTNQTKQKKRKLQ